VDQVEAVINLKTAKALDLDLPSKVLALNRPATRLSGHHPRGLSSGNAVEESLQISQSRLVEPGR
jgi:hypothetical protein